MKKLFIFLVLASLITNAPVFAMNLSKISKKKKSDNDDALLLLQFINAVKNQQKNEKEKEHHNNNLTLFGDNNAKAFKCDHNGCNYSSDWKGNRNRHKSTCPFAPSNSSTDQSSDDLKSSNNKSDKEPKKHDFNSLSDE